MAVIDDQVIEEVEILAKLALTKEEREQAKADMQEMLDYVDQLGSLDTEGVEPSVHLFSQGNVFREDEEVSYGNKEGLLANAPKAKDGQYQVPKTVE